jgi:hypothetical protein
MLDVTTWSGGLIAVGRTGSGGEFDAGIWLSPDGEWWEKIEDPTVLGGPGEQVIRSVLPFGEGLIAAGDSGPVGSRDAVIWQSEDGRTWRRLESPAFGGPGSQMMLALTAWEGGLAAVGLDYSGEFDGAVWTSSDGEAWQRVIPGDPTVFGGAGDQILNSVTAWEGGLVAVGSDSTERIPIAVRSADGIAWERVGLEDADLTGQVGAEMRDVIVWDNHLIAVGVDVNGIAEWLSSDGREWDRVGAEVVDSGQGEFWLHAATDFDGALVAVGMAKFFDQPGGSNGGVWTAEQGPELTLSYQLSESDDYHSDREIWALTPWGGGLIAVGETYGCTPTGPCDGNSDAAVWRFG